MTDEGIRVVRQWLGASSPLEEGTWHSKRCYRKSLTPPFKHLKTIIHISSSWWFPWTDLVFWLLNKWFRLCCSGWKSSQHRSFASGYYSRPCWKFYPEVQSYSAQPRVCKNDDHAPVYTFRICTMQKTFVLTLRSFKLNRFLLFYSFLWVKLLITLWICHIMANPAWNFYWRCDPPKN